MSPSGDKERQAVDDVLRSGWLSMGRARKEFERALVTRSVRRTRSR